MNVLIIDLETTGLNPSTDVVIEVGAILYSISFLDVLAQFSSILPAGSNPAYAVNGISPDLLEANRVNQGRWHRLVESTLGELCHHTDVVVAYNADFEKRWIDQPPLSVLSKYPLADAMAMPWQKARKTGCSLVQLALDYHLPILSAHRALADCDLVARLFSAVGDSEEIMNMLRVALEEPVIAVADVSYSDKDLAKKAGFRWNQSEAPNMWSRKIRPSALAALQETAGFTIVLKL